MDDFTAALYLGLRHPARDLPSWQHLTTGVPAALREPAVNRRVATEVATLQGLERGVLAPSSLHLFWDVMGHLGKETLILADAHLYQVGRWGLERAACQGAKVVYFKHHHPESLQRQVQKQVRSHWSNLVVLTDGWCPHCGRAAPLPAYLALVRKHQGLLLLDDTQALGVLGQNPAPSRPYGEGGGGLLRWFGLQGPEVLTVCSLAKGFGVPLSVLSGSSFWIKKFLRKSQTRVHCSPASMAHVQAARQALTENRKCGDLLRQKLLQNVRLFKLSLAQAGFSCRGGLFPVQTLAPTPVGPPQLLYRQLSDRGVQALLLEPHQVKVPRVSFCLSAAHSPDQIKRAAVCLSHIRQSVLQPA
jgi:8-amino-7-oxononanoate synthase